MATLTLFADAGDAAGREGEVRGVSAVVVGEEKGDVCAMKKEAKDRAKLTASHFFFFPLSVFFFLLHC